MCALSAGCGMQGDSVSGTGSQTLETGNTGISEDSPYKDKGFDLSQHEDVVMYVVGERPADLDRVLEKLNKDYLEPWLNSTLVVNFISWADSGTKYSLLLTGGEKVDLIFTAAWLNYASESGNGAFKELDTSFLETYMPYSYPIQASTSWDQVAISGKVFCVPRNCAEFNNYNLIAMRSDLMEKYGFKSISSWSEMKEVLYTIAETETENGIYANGQRSNNEFGDHLWWQNTGVEPLASGTEFMYRTNNSEELPDWDKDVFYKYLGEEWYTFCLEMAEMAAHNVWSPNKINDSSDAYANFESGKTASLIWNGTILAAGDSLENAGLGTYEVYDVTPNTKACRGSYADGGIAIPASSTIAERAALVLDCIKGFYDVNLLVMGGLEGEHYVLTEDGHRQLGPAADNYGWGCWEWGTTRQDMPTLYSDDPRQKYMDEVCSSKEYAPKAAGFTFDSSNVETEMSVINALVEEYQQSFNLGVFGDETKDKYEEFISKLKDAGVDRVIEECHSQWQEYYNKKSK